MAEVQEQPSVVETDGGQTQGGGQDASYFGHLREDVLAMVPARAESVLSVGCGAGRTESLLVERGLAVTGIELDEEAAAVAAERGLEMLRGDATAIDAQLADRRFDCLLYADVLEHIADPVSVMRGHVDRLHPGGCAIISVPNFRHWSVFLQLFAQGHVRYTDAGIFDRTHVRLTTRKMIQEWFAEVGLSTDAIDYRLWRKRDEMLSRLTLGLFREVLAYQVILRGVKAGGSA